MHTQARTRPFYTKTNPDGQQLHLFYYVDSGSFWAIGPDMSTFFFWWFQVDPAQTAAGLTGWQEFSDMAFLQQAVTAVACVTPLAQPPLRRFHRPHLGRRQPCR